MKKIVLIVFILFVLKSCKPKRSCNLNYYKIVETVMCDMTLDHPSGIFIPPPVMGQNIDHGLIDLSQNRYGLSKSFSDSVFRVITIKGANDILRKYKVINICSIDIEDKNLSKISNTLGMKLEFTKHNPRRSVFGYNLNRPEALFYFSSIRVLSQKEQRIYAVTVLFLCGKLCGEERLYLLTHEKAEFRISEIRYLNPYEVK